MPIWTRVWPTRPTGFVRSCFVRYGSGSNVTPFVIVFLPRTGSNLLASTLDSHPDILCHHEVFNRQGPHRSQSARDGSLVISLGSAEMRDADPWQFLEMMFCNVGERADGSVNRVRAVGAKISPYDDPWVLFSLLANRRVKKIVVDRNNTLAAYVSGLFAQQTGNWAVFGTDSPSPGTIRKVAVDPDHYRAYARKRTVFRKAISAIELITRQKFHRVEYATLRDPAEIRRVFRFLSVNEDFQPLERMRKQADRSLADRISNYDELSVALQNSRHVAFLGGE